MSLTQSKRLMPTYTKHNFLHLLSCAAANQKQRKKFVSVHSILKKQREKKVGISPHACAQYMILVLKPNPNLGLSEIPSTTSSLPFCKLFLDCIRRNSSLLPLIFKKFSNMPLFRNYIGICPCFDTRLP